MSSVLFCCWKIYTVVFKHNLQTLNDKHIFVNFHGTPQICYSFFYRSWINSACFHYKIFNSINAAIFHHISMKRRENKFIVKLINIIGFLLRRFIEYFHALFIAQYRWYFSYKNVNKFFIQNCCHFSNKESNIFSQINFIHLKYFVANSIAEKVVLMANMKF